MNAILYKLLFIINQEKEGSTFYSIALNLLNNLQNLETITIEHISEICNVSFASVSRFCREIGYEDFSDFKYCIKHDVDDEIYISRVSGKKIEYNMEIEEYKNFYLQQTTSNIKKILTNIDLKAIDSIVQDLYKYKHVIAMGLLHSEYACMTLQAKMMKLNKIIITLIDSKDQYDYLHSANDDTLILIFSLTGNYPLKILYEKDRNGNYMKDSSAKVILLTNNKNFPEMQLIDQIVYLGGTVSENNYKFLNNNTLAIAVDVITYRYGNYLAQLSNHKD